ncbi:MAG: ABC transporter permease [Candidatus Aminicenantes bacterium]|nr:ABC transporter permease [Candidatus Aminicenantes bacterium]
MLKNQLKIFWRILIHQKVYTVINLAGLAVGMASCIMILLWVQDENNFDRFHEYRSDLYRIVVIDKSTDQVEQHWTTPCPLGPALKEQFPEVIRAARMNNFEEVLIQSEDKSFMESRVYYTDPDFLAMFTFPFLYGDFQTALSEPNSVVLTEKSAERYFGRDNPLGRTLTLDKAVELVVTGVIQNPPSNSLFKMDILCPWILAETVLHGDFKSWNSHFVATFILLSKGKDVDGFNQKIIHFLDKYDVEALKEEIYAQPLKRIHLYSGSITPRYEGQGDIKYIYIFSYIAIFVLIIACINFMNLSTARSANRAKEVGLRKVIGASQPRIIVQFYGESLLLSFLSLFLALLVVEVYMPFFRAITGKEISLYSAGSVRVLLGLSVIAFLTGLIAGTYPALYLSRFQPASVIKGIYKQGRGGAVFRRILVVIQFVFSLFLIICAAVAFLQLRFMQNKDLGFDQSHLLYMPLRGDLDQKYEAVRSEILKSSAFIGTSMTSTVPRQGIMFSGPADRWSGSDPGKSMTWYMFSVNSDFLDTFKIPMVEGHFFSRGSKEAEKDRVVINQTASRAIGNDSPLGKRFTFWGNEYVIIGVVKDFHFRSMHHSIGPLILLDAPQALRFLFVRIHSDKIIESILFLKQIWKKFVPEYPFEYHFYNEAVGRWYGPDRKISSLFYVFSWLAVFISCLGLFGLSSYMTELRTKEIGIRKVMGASAAGVWLLLSMEFTRLIVIANLISWPIAYFFMKNWLQNFAFRIRFGFWIFLAAGILTLVIAWLTISFQVIKAAWANPIDALRYE